MIELTRIDDSKITLNEHNIELMEETPDTIITFSNGHLYIVKEKICDIIELIVEYNRRIMG